MIEYIKLFWEGAPEGEPSVILYEVDTGNGRLALRDVYKRQMNGKKSRRAWTRSGIQMNFDSQQTGGELNDQRTHPYLWRSGQQS